MHKPSLKNLRPALAGLIVDHEVGDKEIYATFFDLVLRGMISRTRLKGVWIYRKNITENKLTPYEGSIYDIIGADGKTETECKYLLAKLHLFQEEVIRHAIEEGIYKASFNKHLIARSEYSTGAYQIVFVGAFILSLTATFGGNIGTGLVEKLLISGVILIVCFFILIQIIGFNNLSNSFRNKRHGVEITDSMSEKSKAKRKKYRELYLWLKAHPLKEARWSNEFLPYAIAFGLYKNYREFPK